MSSPLKHPHYLSRNVLPLFSLKTICKIYTCVVLIIACFTPVSYCSTCPSSNSISNSINSDQCSFTGYTQIQIFNAVSGPVSNSLYYLYFIYTPYNCAVRKVNPDGTLAWMTALLLQPLIKSLAVDALDQFVYVASYTSPLNVLRLNSNTGAIVDAQT